MPENTQSFRNDETDSPDHFIKKMKKTMEKKRKNNFKNIEELKNIYDETDDGFKLGEIDEAFDELEESLKNMLNSSGDNKRKNKNKKIDEEEDVEGFSIRNNVNYENIYKPEYEFDRKQLKNRQYGKNSKKYANLKLKAKSGKLTTTEMKDLLNIGLISQWQYNELLGLSLNFRGFNWQNTDIPKKKERCPKGNNYCGSTGPSIIDYIL